MPERLQKILARAGVASRRAAEGIITSGRVSVNGTIVTELGTKADPQKDEITVDGRPLRPPVGTVHIALFKPRGVICTRSDPEGRPTVMDLLPKVPGLFPVGRLDTTTEGLILLTNDGQFAERAAHPRYEVPRVYHAKVHRVPGPETLERLKRGVEVEGVRMSADHVRVLSSGGNAWLEVTLHEGKHHEVRRLLEAVGHPVSKLRRVAFGPVSLRGLAVGQFRELTRDEVRALLKGGQGLERPVAAPKAPRPVRPRVALVRENPPGAAHVDPVRPGVARPSADRPGRARTSSTRPARSRPASTRPARARPAEARGSDSRRPAVRRAPRRP